MNGDKRHEEKKIEIPSENTKINKNPSRKMNDVEEIGGDTPVLNTAFTGRTPPAAVDISAKNAANTEHIAVLPNHMLEKEEDTAKNKLPKMTEKNEVNEEKNKTS